MFRTVQYYHRSGLADRNVAIIARGLRPQRRYHPSEPLCKLLAKTVTTLRCTTGAPLFVYVDGWAYADRDEG